MRAIGNTGRFGGAVVSFVALFYSHLFLVLGVYYYDSSLLFLKRWFQWVNQSDKSPRQLPFRKESEKVGEVSPRGTGCPAVLLDDLLNVAFSNT